MVLPVSTASTEDDEMSCLTTNDLEFRITPTSSLQLIARVDRNDGYNDEVSNDKDDETWKSTIMGLLAREMMLVSRRAKGFS